MGYFSHNGAVQFKKAYGRCFLNLSSVKKIWKRSGLAVSRLDHTFPARLVNSVIDDMEEMWQRLHEKYGEPVKVADVIVDVIKRFRVLREGEDKR